MRVVADPKPSQTLKRRLRRHELPNYQLRLYITGMTERSTQSISIIKAICEEHLPEHYSLQVIDMYQQPELASGDQILAAPTLIKQLPRPLRRLVGNLSNRERVLVGLDLPPNRPE